MDFNNLYNLFFDNIKKVFYPEEWLEYDTAFSKSELMTMLLVERQGEMIMSQIAEYINLPMSTTSGIVDRLVRSGYLRRERSEEDRRIVVIKLAEEGKLIIGRLKETILEYINKISQSLTEEEIQLLIKIFHKIIRVIDEDDKKKTPGEPLKENQRVKTIPIE